MFILYVNACVKLTNWALSISDLLPNAKDKKLKVKIDMQEKSNTTIGENEVVKLLQDLIYLRAFYEVGKIKDPHLRKELEQALGYREGNRVLRVAEGCCELHVYCPTEDGKVTLMQNRTKINQAASKILLPTKLDMTARKPKITIWKPHPLNTTVGKPQTPNTTTKKFKESTQSLQRMQMQNIFVVKRKRMQMQNIFAVKRKRMLDITAREPQMQNTFAEELMKRKY